ncbi:MAG: reverse transcriptase domain-containing protein [Pseudomonadota bacterium]
MQEDGSPAATGDLSHLQNFADVARFLEVSRSSLSYWLYGAPESARYTTFEIPKRSGGVRRIDAPTDVIREAQDALLPHLYERHNPHPASHGFLPGRSIVSNAEIHQGQRLVLNVDLADFFPTINFGRVRGLFMAQPFLMGDKAATVCANICTHRNGLPQGAPTSPILSNYIATALDRRLNRLARENGLKYSRYADDITFSTNKTTLPPSIAYLDGSATLKDTVHVGEALERAITSCGFSVNPAKVRLQSRAVRQSVTGVTVNQFPNVGRKRVRRIRAMIHAWEKFGLPAAGQEHLRRFAPGASADSRANADRTYRNTLYGELAFVKMVRGPEEKVFLNLCAKLAQIDPNPPKFLRQMLFGADDYDIFISHAREDKAEIARPIFEACEKLGLKAFLDEEHIGWGQQFTQKINVALGAARTVLAIVSTNSVGKDWPVAEMNAALGLEVDGEKTVAPLIVGKPDMSRIPLMRQKDAMFWDGDAEKVAVALKRIVKGTPAAPEPTVVSPAVAATSEPQSPIVAAIEKARTELDPSPPEPPAPPSPPVRAASPPLEKPKRGFWARLFGRR